MIYNARIYEYQRSLHVSDRFSVHHQESSTIYTTIGICHTGYADCLLAGSGWNNLIRLASNQYVREAGWVPGPDWTGVENLAATGIRSPDRPACSESLYRLNYRGPMAK